MVVLRRPHDDGLVKILVTDDDPSTAHGGRRRSSNIDQPKYCINMIELGNFTV